jgi:thiol-disulfide isomerase/thioredoxin
MNNVTLAAIVATLVVIFVILGFYMGTGVMPGSKIIQQRPPLNHNAIDPGQAKFMFFFATWCPYCRDAEPEILSLKTLIENKMYTYGGHQIAFENINAYADKGKAALYKIKQYPTFKVETKDTLYEFQGKPTVSNLRAFLVTALGAEKSS